MFPSDLFHHCPRCGAPAPAPGASPFDCAACGCRLYFNPAVSVSAFIERPDGRVLLIRRAKEPSKGKLAPPGGFVDFEETAETATAREVREETGLEIRHLRYLVSLPNEYLFRGVTYRILDLFFVAEAVDPAASAALDDVDEVLWMEPAAMRPEDMAFSSTARAVLAYQAAVARRTH